MPVLTLNSRSSTVRLLRIKNLSFCDEASPAIMGLGDTSNSTIGPATSASTCALSGTGSVLGPAVTTAGPVGAVTPAALSTVLLRSLLTRRTDWNFESCNFCCAALQVSSSLKLANAQLLLEIRKRDSNPDVSLQTWWTRIIRSVCGGRLPIHIACPNNTGL